jgi:ferredoxin like protein
MKIEEKLYLVRYNTDEESHLEIISQEVCEKCADKPCTFMCPAKVYKWNGEMTTVSYEGCLECGACRFSCPYENISWNYPRGGFGVCFKFG